MKKDPAAIYTPEFYIEHAAGRKEYQRVADVVHELFPELRDVLDVGCGPGFALHRLQELGHYVRGIEGSVHALGVSPIKDAINIADITVIEADEFDAADLVVCTEVAEHLDAEHADHLVALLSGLARSAIYFTAATPGQGGQDHVNEQPREYWVAKFAAAGWVLDETRTSTMRLRLFEVVRHQIWYPLNSMIFVRPGAELPAAVDVVDDAAAADISVAMVVPVCGWDPARIASRQQLKAQLGPPPSWVTPKLVVSDQWTHVSRWFRKAVEYALDQNTSHVLVMQDDSRVGGPDFWRQLRGMLTAKPDSVIALYTTHADAAHMHAAGLKWLATMDAIPGVAWVCPAHTLRSMFAWEEKELRPGYEMRMPEDGRIGLYCAVHGIPILQSLPGLVEHGAPDALLPSNYGSDKLSNRTASLTWKQAALPAHWRGPALWAGRMFKDTAAHLARNVREWSDELMAHVESGSHPALREAPALGIVPVIDQDAVQPELVTSSRS